MSSHSDIIKQRVSMQAAARHYGFEPNRAGFISCPFHNENTPSLKIFNGDRRWHCFGCGAGGSVIDFVMRLFGITFGQALVRIDNDFGLNLLSGHRGRRSPGRIDPARQKERIERQKFESEYMKNTAQYRRLWSALMRGHGDAKTIDELDPEYVESLIMIPRLDYYFDANPWR